MKYLHGDVVWNAMFDGRRAQIDEYTSSGGGVVCEIERPEYTELLVRAPELWDRLYTVLAMVRNGLAWQVLSKEERDEVLRGFILLAMCKNGEE